MDYKKFLHELLYKSGVDYKLTESEPTENGNITIKLVMNDTPMTVNGNINFLSESYYELMLYMVASLNGFTSYYNIQENATT